ncbi:MAG: peptide chain release factor 1 [Roseomonas sp.]|nr:peptide chain release factor 1 [Roseomonas sp.]MCA3327338.1 peptide chain release factor 1 [Roseomonas sp.]MCA3330763.1 peptide chain release factor 1 [Roseomonas sp.]MCA3334252.1 peptide chain release factor 1 [Roseomonas sp.]MCA3347299.1 peptide chain release factor 1 [Roseomonas sp.]
MSEAEIARKTAELDRLLNDPETRLDAGRVWALAQELKLSASGAVNSRRAA